MNIKTIKIVTIGDYGVGKTTLLMTYTASGSFPQEYVPTALDNFIHEATINGKKASLSIWDTAGGEYYHELRPLIYPETDILLLLFAIENRESFLHIKTNWITEINQYIPGIPIILVGTKIDLRDSDLIKDKSNFVKYKEGLALSKEIGASHFCECSSRMNLGLEELFKKVIKLTNNNNNNNNNNKCIIL
ncbi:Rho GTPase [Dictyostelium discoideum AX4]|uniref:Rho-related protein racM n=1 Tax=Dictyostelium discoideum TaxID=44689 RepID=RACM_DICDI|nr:Rho GTPase [Dictyostelium discoideum AX4]Q54HZ7.2 RecName: Full=Rho-related protein racM; Flags: Precursor [Dictyostelium discoideum]EAL62901.2 Rho GTPase [Dictyostelium discoideum AX4]|eukprot:XP_636408.2 Rho GTPase [Dictyostelium discoideum AX4]